MNAEEFKNQVEARIAMLDLEVIDLKAKIALRKEERERLVNLYPTTDAKKVEEKPVEEKPEPTENHWARKKTQANIIRSVLSKANAPLSISEITRRARFQNPNINRFSVNGTLVSLAVTDKEIERVEKGVYQYVK